MRGPDGSSLPRFRRELPSPVPPHPADTLITPARAALYRQVLARRSGRLAVLIEDCHDPHNATAVIRTCDAFGVQRLLVTTARNSFKINRKICQGSDRYIDIEVHPGVQPAYARLRAAGFRILCTDLKADAVIGPQRLADDLVRQPIALVFGSEGQGVSAEASAQADGHVLIPMVGFPQSLNLSVSVAVSLYALLGQRLSEDAPGDLTPAEQCAIYERWVLDHAGPAGAALIQRTRGRHDEDLDEYRA